MRVELGVEGEDPRAHGVRKRGERGAFPGIVACEGVSELAVGEQLDGALGASPVSRHEAHLSLIHI